MRTAPRLAALVPLALVLLPAPGSAGSGCAQAVATVALAGFPPQATSQPFYDAVEGSGPASFTVQTGGHACGVEVSVRYVVESDPADTATPGEDYEPKAGRTEDLNVDHRQGEYEWQTVPVPVMDDAVVESPVESARVVLSEPQGGTLKRPSSAPLYLVDDDGDARVAVGPGPFSAAEGTTAMIPVFRAGDAGGSVTVDSAVEPGPENPATPGEDYDASPGTVSFGPGGRVGVISFSIVDDAVVDPGETVSVSVSGAAVPEPSAVTVTILDNEEGIAPTSRFHHPREGLRYPYSDYRIREIHVFTDDAGDSGVVRTELALRKRLKGGACAWWTGERFFRGGCSDQQRLRMSVYDPGSFYYYRIKALAPSVGTETRIRDYTAYSRSTDDAGNVESVFEAGRNGNTFEVRSR